MQNKEPQHLSDEQLAQFEDGELPERGAEHIASCPHCSGRLRDLRDARSAYALYWQINRRQLPPPRKDWHPLEVLVAQHQVRQRGRNLRVGLLFSLAASLCIVAVVLFYEHRQSPSSRMNELLTRSEKIEAHGNTLIAIHVRGRVIMRPATLRSSPAYRTDPDLAHLEALFNEADYDWREPLSSRSFQRWRHHLKRKRDFVSIVWEQGDERAYRVRTETPTGILRSAALTLRARDLRTTSGAFDFEKEGNVELAETGIPVQPVPERPHSNAKKQSSEKRKSSEVAASPADTLHVLAALDRIGADVGEPINISEDARRGTVVVHATGLSDEREQEIRRVLKALPRTTLELNSSSASASLNSSGLAGNYTDSVPPALRLRFEEQTGGSIAFQEMTDRVLEASSSALARAHALQVLAQHFPPTVEESLSAADRQVLRTLWMNHIDNLQQLIERIHADLRPILPASEGASGQPSAASDNLASWQAGIQPLVDRVQDLDKSLNVLLAGSYSQSAGENMLRVLPAQLKAIDSYLRLQRLFIR
jgi:hypothetical protein